MKLVINGQLIGSCKFIKSYAIPFSAHKPLICFGCNNIAHVLNKYCIEYHYRHTRIISAPHTILVCNDWRML